LPPQIDFILPIYDNLLILFPKLILELKFFVKVYFEVFSKRINSPRCISVGFSVKKSKVEYSNAYEEFRRDQEAREDHQIPGLSALS
jgi:hypothetical protein